MLPTNFLGIICALASALFWGSGDFSGGVATRRSDQFQVLALSAVSGLALLVGCAILWREPWPSSRNLLWASMAGLSGSIGLAALYRALALGHAATVAPVAAVVSAALSVVFSAITEGLPGTIRLAGFTLALLGIWMVSSSSISAEAPRQGLRLALLAGFCFAGFFILVAQVEAEAVFFPLVMARCVMVSLAVLLLLLRGPTRLSFHINPLALLAGILDASGNVFYLLAQQFTRLDVAVVIGSLYPVTTVVLSWVVLEEKISRMQWLGAMVCFVAIALIAL